MTLSLSSSSIRGSESKLRKEREGSLSFLRPSFELWIFHSNFGFFQGCSFERDGLVWLRLKEECGWGKEEWMGFYFFIIFSLIEMEKVYVKVINSDPLCR